MKYTALFLFAILFMPAFTHAEESDRVIFKTQGQSFVVRNGKDLSTEPGMHLEKEDILKTGPNSQLDLTMNGLVGIRLLAETQVRIMETEKEKMEIELKMGNIIANLKKLVAGSDFKVESQTATLAVRGTQFWGRVNAPVLPITTFAVREGNVNIIEKSSGKSFDLTPGQALDIPETGGAISTRQAKPEEMQALEQAAELAFS